MNDYIVANLINDAVLVGLGASATGYGLVRAWMKRRAGGTRDLIGPIPSEAAVWTAKLNNLGAAVARLQAFNTAVQYTRPADEELPTRPDDTAHARLQHEMGTALKLVVDHARQPKTEP